MKVLLCIVLLGPCLGILDHPGSPDACGMLQSLFVNESYHDIAGANCGDLEVTHSESITGGFCLASMTAAGYYRTGAVNPVADLLLQLSGSNGNAPVITASNSGGTMFVIRYFSYRDIPVQNKWTYPCYMLNSVYRSVCFFHGNFGVISEECYAESQNLISAAVSIIYGDLQKRNGGPLGVVASYCGVYFPFLSNLPISADEALFKTFWQARSHLNTKWHAQSNWVIGYTTVNPIEASGGTASYNYGFNSYLSRGLDAHSSTAWYTNVSVYTAASISANTLSGFNLLPFSFAGKEWDNSDDAAAIFTVMKLYGLVLSYIMVKKLDSTHAVLVTRMPMHCESGCPLLDGAFTDNGPVTPILAVASGSDAHLRPYQVSILGPTSTMGTIKYLLGIGHMELFGQVNICPFTEVTKCEIMDEIRVLTIPELGPDVAVAYRSLNNAYSVYRPNQQIMKAFCADPLIYDHFSAMCKADGICHVYFKALPGRLTMIQYTLTEHTFVLTMIWLGPTKIGARFVHEYIPSSVLTMKYYVNMALWFPDFNAVAPEKGGVGFTKIAGHSVLDYLTYLVQRLVSKEIYYRVAAYKLATGVAPPCGYRVFAASQQFFSPEADQLRID